MPSRVVESIDTYRRGHRWLGVPLAVAYKFGDDRGPYLTALITYYGFLSLPPAALAGDRPRLRTPRGFRPAGEAGQLDARRAADHRQPAARERARAQGQRHRAGGRDPGHALRLPRSHGRYA